ncbi:MAG: ATP-binding cassette domain-containing protein [Polyangiaceae bacterium]
MASDGRLSARLCLQRWHDEPRFSLDVTLDFGPGLSVLFGPSGSGKSTILAALAGLLRPDAGRTVLGSEVLFDSELGINLAPNERSVALVFQSLALFPHLDALANVSYGIPRVLGKSERVERAKGWLARLRVEHLARRYPGTYSGGEAQRVALARALASEPRALLLDEPFSALDQELATELSAELVSYVTSLAIPVVLVTHDRKLARALGHDVTLLRAGRVEGVGEAHDVLAELSRGEQLR